MKRYLVFGVAFAALFYCLPVEAQNSGAVPQYAVPIGKGAGVTGFGSAAPGATGTALVSNGPGANPTFQSVGSASFVAQNANKVFSGPTTGADAVPTFRALVGADLPLPGAASLGGVQSLSASTNNFLTGLGTDGAFTRAQPGFSNLSGSATCAQLPALTGNVTTSAGSCATTIAGGAVSNSMLAGSIAASKLIGTDIATVGTLTAGATGAGFTVNLGASTITGTLPAARLPAPTVSTLGAVNSKDCSSGFVRTIGTDGSITCASGPAAGQVPGTATNDDASAGKVGEYYEASVSIPGPALTSDAANVVLITSPTLGAGDWDCTGVVVYVPASTTNTVYWYSTLSSSNNDDFTLGHAVQTAYPNTGSTQSTRNFMALPVVRFSSSSSFTVKVTLTGSFTISTATAYGTLRCRRMR